MSAFGGKADIRFVDWLKTSSIPKLFVKAEPGGILAGGPKRACAD